MQKNPGHNIETIFNLAFAGCKLNYTVLPRRYSASIAIYIGEAVYYVSKIS